MCIVIDANCFTRVFDSNCAEHEEFNPVLVWISRSEGYAVYGGTKYICEMRKASQFLKYFTELNRAGRFIQIDTTAVDAREMQLISILENTDCDDQHLIALLGVSGCKLICTKDKKAMKYLKNNRLYPEGAGGVKIYQSKRNARQLLNRKNLVTLKNVI